ncbi:MAG: phage protein [Caulobacter sp.]|nr:phage protein [Caulobacter sp.]
MKANPAITSFNAGLLSPLLGGRPDLEKWQSGLIRCDNLIPRVQGALQRAAGSVFVGAVKDSAMRCWLAPFVFSQADAFVLEFGPGYIRFFRNRGRLVDEDEDVFEIESPYLAPDLTRPDGSFGVRFEQSGDVVYLACAGHAPRVLKRLSNLNWVLEVFEAKGGPFQDANTDEAITVLAAGTLTVGGTVTLTANNDIFQAGHVGGLFELELKDGADVRAWQVRTTTDVGDRRRADYRHYLCAQVGPVDTTDKPAICGEELPVHTRGKYWDGTGEEQKGDGAVGSIGVEWEYLHSGYGHVRITAVTSGTEATGEVVARLPDELVAQPTHRWAFGAWSAAAGWPDNVCFFRERLSWFRGQQVWHSTAGDFANFEARTHGEVLPDSAVVLSIQSAQGNPIEWAAPTRSVLFIGAGGGEHSLKAQTSSQAYGPGNTQQDPETAWGGVGVEPVQVGAGVVFVEKLGRRLRLLVPAQDGYEALDLNKYRGQLRFPIVAMAWQQTPHESIWCVTAEGGLEALTLQLEDKVFAWRRHLLGLPGLGAVESVAVIPSPDGGRDDVWLIVRRLIDGETRRYVERLAAECEAGDDQALSVYAAAALTYDGAPTATLSGLEHLEGETVTVKADGAAHPDRVVSGGAITLQAPAGKAVVGLAAPYAGQLMPLEAGAAAGSAQGRIKRVHALTVRLLDSLGGRFGPAIGRCDPLQHRQAGEAMDGPPALTSGDIAMTFPGGYDGAATIAFEGDDGFPFTLIGLYPELVTYEG